MVDCRPLLLFPMQLTGIPTRVARWLREAGLPTVEFSSGAVADGRDNAAASCRIVLFDSRTPASRADAVHAAARGWKTIDVARLLTHRAQNTDDDSQIVLFDESPPLSFPRYQRREFFERLKQKIESADGVWARIADYPFPSRCAVVEFREGDDLDSIPFEDGSDPWMIPFDEGGPLPVMCREHYAAGRPILVPTDGERPGDRLSDAIVQSDQYPLVWRTTPAEFANWWRIRDEFSFRLEQRNSQCRIDCNVPTGELRPALEIWRGNHVAALPLSTGRMEVQLSGLVFQQSGGRHPAGISALSHSPNSTETNLTAHSAG